MHKLEAERIIRNLRKLAKQARSSKEAALECLRKAGLVTKSGKPTKPYRSIN